MNGDGVSASVQMQRVTFKSRTRELVIALVVVIGLVSYNITIPKGRTRSKNWNFVLTHPTILIHIIVGSLVLIGAVALLLRSVHSRVRSWIVVSGIGLTFVIIAFAMGEQYVSTLSNTDLSDMGLGWFGAIAAYGVGWYLSRASKSSTEAT